VGSVRDLKAKNESIPPAGAVAAEAPPLSRRERQRLETRERLFEMALEEFRTAGFASTQIDRIAERAGVSRGTFYFHFPTKDHVLLELQLRREREILGRIQALGPPPDDVRAFLRRIYAAIAESLDVDVSLRRELMAMYVRQSEARPVLAAEPLLVELADYFAEAAERGAIRADIPAEALAIHFLSGLFPHLLGEADRRERDEAVQLAIEIFLSGIAR